MDIDKENMTAFAAEGARRIYDNLSPDLLKLLEDLVWACGRKKIEVETEDQ